MRQVFAVALAAALGIGGMVTMTNDADARQGFRGNFGGGVGGKMGGFGGFRGGMSSPKFSGGGFGAMRGPRMAAPGVSGPRMGNFNRSFGGPGKWSGPGNWGGNKWAGRGWSGKHWKHSGNWGRHHKRRFYGYPYLYAAPFVAGAYYYGSDYGYGGNCDWLYDRAVATGSGYWWSRYNECVYDY